MDPRRVGVTRRELLAAGAAGLASASTPALAERDRPYGPFRMGIQSYSLRGYDLETALKMTEKEGLHYWEAFQAHIPLLDSRDKIADVLAKAKSHGVKVAAWGVEGFD